jgi:hypothetical protein
MESIRPEAIRAHMNFLADDLLEGRGTNSRGYEISARYMAAEFESMGLTPAGDAATYLQTVPLRSVRPDEPKSTFSIVRNGKAETLVFRKDFCASGDPARKETSVEAPVVYVGFGVTAPEQNYDDYKAIDAMGKIVAMVSEAPGSPGTGRSDLPRIPGKAPRHRSRSYPSRSMDPSKFLINLLRTFPEECRIQSFCRRAPGWFFHTKYAPAVCTERHGG